MGCNSNFIIISIEICLCFNFMIGIVFRDSFKKCFNTYKLIFERSSASDLMILKDGTNGNICVRSK